MKAIYNCCIADPFIGVARDLRNQYNYDPILWIGYEYDNSINLVKDNFPNAQYLEYWDAWRGVFPSPIEEIASDHCLDINFLNHIARYELQAMKSMDRMDPDGHSFSFKERQRFFRRLLQCWDAFILHYQPDLYVNAVIPHRVFDFALYLVCKYRGVKTVSYMSNSMPGRIMPLDNIFRNDRNLFHLYQKYKKDAKNISLPNDIKSQLDKLVKPYVEGRPAYMVEHERKKRANSNFLRIVRNTVFDLLEKPSRFFGARGYLQRGFHPYWAEQKKSIEDSHYKLFKYAYYRSKTFIEKRKLERLYVEISEAPQLDTPYIFFGLHYQPEATTSPAGDIFVDQMLAVQLIASKIPSDWLVYVKENPLQFSHLSEGQTYRQRSYYTDALKNPKIRFVPLNSDPYRLIDNARAVGTITGTLGWEAMVRRKPVLIFGQAWYEYYDGVLRVEDSFSADSIVRFIKEFSFSESNFDAYLAAFDEYSVVAYHYDTIRGKVNIEEKKCIDNLVESIIRSIESVSTAV